MSNRSAATLPPWTRGALSLLLPPGATAVLPGDLAAVAAAGGGVDITGPSDRHWHCTGGAVVLGEKPRVFSGIADAHAWRLAAYAAAGVPAAEAWPAYPPRNLTIIVRDRWRGFTNANAVAEVAAETGLPVRMLALSGSDGATSFEAQVAAFSQTGLLLAAHGAALTNIPFLPVGAAVVEVYPFLGAVPVYKRLAETVRVSHFGVRTDYPSAAARASGLEGMEAFSDEKFLAACVEPAIPSADGPVVPRCNLPGKRGQIEAPIARLRDALAAALDEIGCRPTVDGRVMRCRERSGTYVDYPRPSSPGPDGSLNTSG